MMDETGIKNGLGRFSCSFSRAHLRVSSRNSFTDVIWDGGGVRWKVTFKAWGFKVKATHRPRHVSLLARGLSFIDELVGMKRNCPVRYSFKRTYKVLKVFISPVSESPTTIPGRNME